MNQVVTRESYGSLDKDATLTIQRVLPGPIERVWSFLTEGKLRRQWLAAGDMELRVGAPFELAWRNDELTLPPGHRPEGFGTEHRMACKITELDPPRRISFTWTDSGDVTFALEPQGDKVRLTITHRRLSTTRMKHMVGAGWHAHLDVLVARVSGTEPEPFWDHWVRLRQDYEKRVPA